LTVQHIQQIVKIVAKAIAPSTRRLGSEEVRGVEDIRNGESSTGSTVGVEKWVGTGDVGLDEALGGGMRTGVLTEISGERYVLSLAMIHERGWTYGLTGSAAGKSHLCMALSLSAQLPSCTPFPGGSIILTSERELPTDRLIQLAKSMLASQTDLPNLGNVTTPIPTLKQLLDNIHTNKCTDVDALDHALSYSLPWELEKNRLAGKEIRLIVLDSITALFRGADTTYSSTSAGLTHRSRLLCSIADKLKALAVEYDIAVVVINQVSDVFNKLPQPVPSYTQSSGPSQMQPSQAQSAYDYSTQFYTDPGPEPPMLYSTQARWFSGQSQGYRKEASLGIVWANAINTRVMMSRTLRRKRIASESLSVVANKRARRDGLTGNGDGQPDETNHPEDETFGIELDSDAPTLIRRFHLVFSPFAPSSTTDYIIAPSGIHSISGSRRLLDLASILRKRKVMEAIRAEMDDSGVGLKRKEDDNGNGNGNGDGDDEYGLDDSLDDIPAEIWEGKFADQRAEAEAVGVVGDGA
jgi:DNA repair protein RAD57